MSFSEVTELRKQGKLAEAEELARKDLEQDAENVWNKRSLAWVLEAALKQAVECSDSAGAVQRLEQIGDLELPENEEIFWNTLGWQVYFLLKLGATLPQAQQGAFCEKVAALMQKMNWTKNTDGYRMLVKGFYAYRNVWGGFTDFCDWWGLEHLSPADYEMQEMRGEKVISWAERLYIAYAKCLLVKHDADRIHEFLPLISALHEQHPEMTYPGYFICKLMLAAADNPEKAVAVLLPFVRKKRKDFWSWQLLAELFPDDEEKQMACLLMAYYTTRNQAFLGKVTEQLTGKLVFREKYGEARFLIEKYLEEKSKKQQRASAQMLDWSRSDWFLKSRPCPPSRVMDYKPIAMAILHSDLPKHILVITHINVAKNMVSFVYGFRKKGFARWEQIDTLRPGMVMQAQWKEPEKDGAPHRLLALEQCAESGDTDFCRHFKGRLQVDAVWKCAFLKTPSADVFVPYGLLPPECTGGEHEVTALLDFNPKKNEWSWKALRILS